MTKRDHLEDDGAVPSSPEKEHVANDVGLAATPSIGEVDLKSPADADEAEPAAASLADGGAAAPAEDGARKDRAAEAADKDPARDGARPAGSRLGGRGVADYTPPPTTGFSTADKPVLPQGEDRITLLPGIKGSCGARLLLANVPHDASVRWIKLQRGQNYMGATGWQKEEHRIEVTARPRRRTSTDLELALDSDLAARIPVGASVAIETAPHSVKGSVIWRRQTPLDEDPYVAEKEEREARAFRMRPAAIAAGLAAVVAGGFFLFSNWRSPEVETASAPRDEPVRVSAGALRCQTPAPAAPGDELAQLTSRRNQQASLREGRRLALQSDFAGAEEAMLRAACESADAAMEAAVFFDPDMTPASRAFADNGKRLAIRFYELAGQRWQRADAQTRLKQLKTRL